MYYYEKEKSKNKDVPEFTGDKENPIEVWEYNSKNGITPIETIDNEDGSFTHKYADGSKVTIRTTLTGIIDEGIIIRSKTDTKKILSHYPNEFEDELINSDQAKTLGIRNKRKLL